MRFRGYFKRGGFEIGAEQVRVQSRFGRTTVVPRVGIAAVVFAELPRFDSRLLLVDDEGAILAQDQAIFYDDEALNALAAALGVSLRREQFVGYSAIKDAHPDLIRFRWMYKPYLTGIALSVAVLAGTILFFAISDLLTGR